MKKLLLGVVLALSFCDNLSAQFTTNQWYGPYWGWVQPSSTDFSSDLYRQGSLIFQEPHTNDGLSMKNKGIKFFKDGGGTHWDWGHANYGLTLADFDKINLSLSDTYAYNNTSTVLGGYGGVALKTVNGALFMHQNGIVSIGLNDIWSHTSKIRELSRKTINDVNYQTNYTLYVKGGIVTEKVKVALMSSWPDYVFQKDYTLTPLSIVEQHIKEKGYLHKSKSAAEVEKDGIEVAETAKAQQEKIEELFLHLIDMDKRLKAVEAENAQLKADLDNNKK
jgi:hypothetical protein